MGVGWPAEAVEKTCQRVNEDHQNINNLATTRVSAELKMARSLVRLAEIQATLQEQRIMFLRQQSHDLETMKTQTMLEATSGIINSVPNGNAAHERLTSLNVASTNSSSLSQLGSVVSSSGSGTVITHSPAFAPSPHHNSCSGATGYGMSMQTSGGFGAESMIPLSTGGGTNLSNTNHM